MPCVPGCNPLLTQSCRVVETATGGSFSWVDNEISWGDLMLRTSSGSIVTNLLGRLRTCYSDGEKRLYNA
jgi:hypothetical protein